MEGPKKPFFFQTNRTPTRPVLEAGFGGGLGEFADLGEVLGGLFEGSWTRTGLLQVLGSQAPHASRF